MKSVAERRLPIGTPKERLSLITSRSGPSISTKVTENPGGSERQDLGQSLFHNLDTDTSSSPSPDLSVKAPTEAPDMTASYSMSEDLTHLAELANAKLERQSRRITVTDPTVPIAKHKKTKTSCNTKTWVPLNYAAEITDDAISTSKMSQRASPLDVHAKIFLPRSRDSSLEPLRKDSACPSGDEGDFQIGRRSKFPPTALFPGRYAPEIDLYEEPPTILAPFDKHEIGNVFGNVLPSLDYFTVHIGDMDGEVRFGLQANGDITAQQWSADNFSWFNIGAFSNIRKRIEGTLASHRLKGEAELHRLQQHTLSYFRAVALQQEAAVVGRPFGRKDLQAVMPNISMDHNSRLDDYEFDVSDDSDDQAWGHAYQNHHGLPCDFFAEGYTSDLNEEGSHLTDATPPKSLTALNNLAFGLFPTEKKHTITGDGFHFPTLDAWTNNDEVNRSAKAFRHPTISGEASQSCGPVIPQKDQSISVSAAEARRDQMKASLMKIAENAAPRARGSNATARTVLHDPLNKQAATLTALIRPNVPRKFENEKDMVSDSKSSSMAHKSQSLAKPGSDEFSNDLHDNEPDFALKERPMEIYNVTLPPMTTAELAAYSRPSPQHLHGPFFMGDLHDSKKLSQSKYDEDLRLWYHQGSIVAQRQEEFFQRIKTAHKTMPSPIGPPSTKKKLEGNGFNETTTRLLIPVLENLSQYVQGPKKQRHGFLAPFAPPPEWCIDRGPNGNRSFFGEDWGNLPERIGRDARYRPMLFDYGGSSNSSQTPFSSSNNTGRSRYTSGMKF